MQYGTSVIKGMPHETSGAFSLLPGQYTDDTSMGLCLADSLLARDGEHVPEDLMMRFLAWWYLGYNNAFAAHPDGPRPSVGLGGTISQSLRHFSVHAETYTSTGNDKSSGNGSIMRLAAVPVCYHDNLPRALEVARLQSLTTHQGTEAAECCRLMAFFMLRGFHGDGLAETALGTAAGFVSTVPSVQCLAESRAEPGNDPDRNWNWKDPNFHYSDKRASEMPG